ncbi:hypothetical protein HQ563_11240 [bacterium]|nr:hypothetical protein [bacterium]
MKARVLLVLPALLAMLGLVAVCDGAAIIWGGSGAVDDSGALLSGTRGFQVNLSNGALLQLYKAVGGIDDPSDDLASYVDTNYVIDDVLLEEIPIGLGLGPPGGPANGAWSRTTDVNIIPGDVLYVRAYNVPKADVDATSEVGIADVDRMIVSHTVEVVDSPQTYLFDNLKTQPIPEPATLLFLVPGLALWALRKKK